MSYLISIPVLGFALMLQLAVFSRFPLLYGTADLVMIVLAAWSLLDTTRSVWLWTLLGGLMLSFVSAMPGFIFLISFLLMTIFARYLYARVWQVPLLAMFVTVLVGTLIQHVLSLFALRYLGQVYLPVMESINLVTVPSLLLNLFLALPVYGIMKDVAAWVLPVEVD